MLHKHVIFIKHIHRINDHNKIYFFIYLYTNLYFMKNMISSIIDYLHKKYDNLKINKEHKIYLPRSS